MHLTRSEGNFKRTGSWGLWDRFRCTCHIKILYGDSEGATLILNIFLPEISIKISKSNDYSSIYIILRTLKVDFDISIGLYRSMERMAHYMGVHIVGLVEYDIVGRLSAEPKPNPESTTNPHTSTETTELGPSPESNNLIDDLPAPELLAGGVVHEIITTGIPNVTNVPPQSPGKVTSSSDSEDFGPGYENLPTLERPSPKPRASSKPNNRRKMRGSQRVKQ
eukprot:g74121.t1